MNRKAQVRRFFESGEGPWENLYLGDPVTAHSYRNRQRYALRFLRRHGFAGASLLEIGSGPGYLTEELCRKGYEVVSCDIALRMAHATRNRSGSDKVVVADVMQLPFVDACFDAVLMIGVASYVADLDGALRMLRRILRPGGILIISSANTRLLFSLVNARLNRMIDQQGRPEKGKTKKAGFYDSNCNYYRPREFNQHVERAGFDLLERAGVGFGRLKFRESNLVADRLQIALDQALTSVSRLSPFRPIAEYAFANVACFRCK